MMYIDVVIGLDTAGSNDASSERLSKGPLPVLRGLNVIEILLQSKFGL